MKLEKVLDKFEEYCMPKRNLTYERHRFFTRSQLEHESVDQYATELRSRAQSCEFSSLKESLIRDRIICGILDDGLREHLLRLDDLTLDKTLQVCRVAEQTRTQAQALSSTGENASIPVDSLSKNKKSSGKKSNQTRQTKPQDRTNNKTCTRCGNRHTKEKCPAQGKTCKKCGKQNHFAKCCRTPVAKVNELQHLKVDSDGFMICSVDSQEHESKEEWKVNLRVNNELVEFKIDTGAQANTLPETIYHKLKPKPKLQKAKVKLTGYYETNIPVKGRCYVQMEYKGVKHSVQCFIIPGNRQPLLGLRTSEDLYLVKRVYHVDKQTEIKTGKTVVQDYDNVFVGLGCLPGKHHITLKDNAQPVQHACRKVPFPLQKKLKEELDKMENMNVIKQVDEPTDWVSSLVVVKKKNGQLRVCLDPRDLNRAIKREHYKLPSRAEITSQFAGAKYFSKLDASSGFWQIQLDEDSSKLCTFITPYGRYRFLRLPFGICSAPEVFHKIIHNLFVDIPGVNTMMDDIVVWGSTQEEHDDRLRKVLDIAQKSNLKLNRDKCEFNVNQMTFIGDLISQDGVRPDPKKVAAIRNMARPTCKQDIQRFLGMINYQAKFIPNLSTRSAPLRILLDKKVEWMWENEQEKAWGELKEALMSQPVLHFYDCTKPTKISADASKNGLGAVLLQQHEQNWHPIAYASRAMTDAETRYAQIEKELLAITYGCEKFHQYIYGQKIEVETDHKPLIPLFVKSLADCPLRIQRLLIRVQRYDLKVSYTPGKYMFTADTLSRAVDPKAELNVETEEDIRVYVDMIVQAMPVTSNKRQEIVEETKKDVELQELLATIRNGWPESKQQCPARIKQYWNIRSELSEADGIIFKGSKIVIPTSMRRYILNQVHEGHLGIEKCKKRAREVIYWPRINADITEMVQNCTSCLMYKPKQQAESLNPHAVPNRPWEKIAVDLFTLNKREYMVVVDYYSQFIEVCTLTSTTSKAVINHMKAIFARHGTPCELMSDNGPQFASQEFKSFAKEWDFHHTTSSPHYPQSNGLAENAVKIVKNLILKSQHSGQDIHRALQVYRSSPIACGKSPAELLYNRQIRSNLPMLDTLLNNQQIDTKSVRGRKDEQKVKQKERFDKHAHDLPKLKPGDHVILQDMKTNTWSQHGIIKSVNNHNRSYQIETATGEIRRRNRRHLRPDPRHQAESIPLPTQNDFELDDSAEAEPASDVRASSSPSRTTRSGRVVKPPDRLNL
ncbi:uncharacterized protein K02A2.6-like [Lytechinus variegatus]|uniref:uncharacterized protein K02A2.6-like n=1 Tax=Lytechinus variegatus TaxID=7654 RepID=UPI001BB26876|nr:uncharacterized protein K02A2.6-like [Lytechinus variegatus]